MNERIWELFRQANHPHPEHGGNNMFFPEEFAELIIKECAELVEEGVMIRETYKDIYKNFSTADIIRDHFGIKE